MMIEQLRLDRGDRRRQRAFELIERGARLQRRDRVDQIRHGLRLNEIELLIEKRAQRELARLREPRARLRSRARRIESRTTGLPCAEISATSSPVYGARRRKVRDDDLIGWRRCRHQPRLRERGVARLERSVAADRARGQCARASGPLMRIDAETAAAGGVAIATMVSEVENMK